MKQTKSSCFLSQIWPWGMEEEEEAGRDSQGDATMCTGIWAPKLARLWFLHDFPFPSKSSFCFSFIHMSHQCDSQPYQQDRNLGAAQCNTQNWWSLPYYSAWRGSLGQLPSHKAQGNCSSWWNTLATAVSWTLTLSCWGHNCPLLVDFCTISSPHKPRARSSRRSDVDKKKATVHQTEPLTVTWPSLSNQCWENL